MRQKLFTQNNIKKILTRGLVIVLGIGTSFANQDTNLLKNASTMHNMTVFLSWVWVLLSMLAGKLMTNGLLYGGTFGLDVYLWEIWNVMKNIANFAIGFIFLAVVLKEIFAGNIQDELANIVSKLKWFLIGGLLIQASWFMVMALISLSTITATAIGALPSMVIQSDNERGSKIVSLVNSKGALQGSKYVIKQGYTGSPRNLILEYTTGTTVGITNQETLDFLMPRYDNLGGSLYFMGMSVVGFQNYTSENITSSDNPTVMVTGFAIKLAITLTYAFILIILILINISRTIKIWIFIALLPLNIVLWVLKHEGVGVLGEDDMSVGGYVGKFNRGNLIQMILQPTIITGILGISMIALAAFWGVLGSASQSVNTDAINAAYNVTMTNSQFTSDSVDVHMVGNLLDGTIGEAGGMFQGLILIGLVYGMMLLILYASIKITKEEWLENIGGSALKMASSIPFLPITRKMGDLAGGLDKASGGKLKEAYSNMRSGNGLGLDDKGASGFAQWAGVSDPSKTRSLKYQIENAKSFNALQAATQGLYDQQDKKDFQEIFNSTGRQQNFVKHYSQIPNSPLGDIPTGDAGIKKLNEAMNDKEKRRKLRPYLFPGVDEKTIIKGFDEQDKRGNTVSDTPPVNPSKPVPEATTTTKSK